MKIVYKLGFLVLLALVVTGCSLFTGSETAASLTITSNSDDVSRGLSVSRDLVDTNGGTIAFTKAAIGLERIELKMIEDETITGAEDETMYAGPYEVDLLGGDLSTQEIGTVVISAGIYSKIEMELIDTLPGGYSVHIEGTYTPSGGTAADFIYTYENTEDFRIEDSEGFEVEGGNASIILTFDLDDWFAGVDFSTATTTDGVYVINSTSNNTLADVIELNIEAAGEIGFDSNDDGVID